MLTLYGLKSCDTCREARKWLDAAAITHQYHDVRSDGLDAGVIRDWMQQVGWESLVNKRSLTWRKIPEADRGSLDEARATALLLEYPTLLKRPVLVGKGQCIVGFSADSYATLQEKNTGA